ncbi:MAG: ATP-binding protein [Sneathiella sp.]
MIQAPENTEKHQFGLFRKSLGKRIIFYVFIIYLFVAIAVTLIQLSLEFFRVRDTLEVDIAEISRTIYPSLSEQLWNLDNDGIRRSVEGVVEIEKVLGFQVFDETGSLVAAKGINTTQSNQAIKNPLEKSGIFDNYFGHQFDINYVDSENSAVYHVGRGEIFSGRQVVIDTLKYGFLLIIVNSIVKTSVLWFIIYFFITRMVERPVNQLARENRLFNPDQPDLNQSTRQVLREGAKRPDQIGLLFQSYISMRELTARRLQQLQKLNYDGQKIIESSSVNSVISQVENILRDHGSFGELFVFIESDNLWHCQYRSNSFDILPSLQFPNGFFDEAHAEDIIFSPSLETSQNLLQIIYGNSPDKLLQAHPFLVSGVTSRSGRNRLIILSDVDESTVHKKANKLYIGNILQIFSSAFENVSLVESITDKNQQLESAIKALAVSETRFKDFAEASSDWFWEMDADLKFTYISEKFEEVSGCKISERIGTIRQDIAGPLSEADNWGAHHAILEAHRPFKNFEYAIKTPNGETMDVSVSGVPVFDKDGIFSGYRGSGMAITLRKKLEEQLRRSQRMEAIGQLTGGVAHDFNNLLNIILGNAELLEEEGIDTDFAKNRTEEIIKTTLRGAALTSRLLAFSRQQSLSPVTVDISKLIDDLEDMLKRTLGETIALKVNHPGQLWTATIDSHQFENALINLAINARDAMPDGGILTIETNNCTLDESYTEKHDDLMPGDYMTVAVSDTGTGMTAEVLKNVFEPFFTTKEVGKGSGLGLSMVYGFSKQSGGHLSIYSEVDHGTTVQLYVPRSRDKQTTNVKSKADAPKVAKGTESILVVEDDESLRVIPVSILRDCGYQVLEAANGAEAINHLKGGVHFDLLFTDVVLPGGMNGVDIAKEAEQFQPGIKTLFATGYAENAVIQNGKLEAGVNLINKPYSRASLLEIIREILDRSNHPT